MNNFLIEFSISISVFWLFYKLFLENEKIHQFNRFYLLFTLIISFAIPFFSIETIKIIEQAVVISDEFPMIIPQTTEITEQKTNYLPIVLCSLYGLISVVFLVRFLRNLFQIYKTISLGTQLKFEKAILVIVPKQIAPHSFFNYIFLSETDYKNNLIASEILEHEYTHVNQKHSFDIVLIELFKIVLWFHPMLYFYKKSIKLNHEFIADENVIEKTDNTTAYQNLLLESSAKTYYNLASNFNFLSIKKRLIMMTKTTSKTSAFMRITGILPLLTVMVYFMCVDVVAQVKEKQKPISTEQELKDFNEKSTVIVKDKNGTELAHKKPSEITEEDKKNVGKSVKTIEILDEEGNTTMKIEKEIPVEKGYILYNDIMYFATKNEDGHMEYYNRWGVKISDSNLLSALSKSEIITDVETLKEKQGKTSNGNSNLFEVGCKYGTITKNNDKFYIDNKETNLIEKLGEVGYLYVISKTEIKSGTYWFQKKENGFQIYDRWGKISPELTEFLN